MPSVRHKNTFNTMWYIIFIKSLPTVNIFTQRQVEISILVTNRIARWASSWRLAGALRNVFLAKSMLELSYFAHALVLELKFVQICNDAKNNTITRNIVLGNRNRALTLLNWKKVIYSRESQFYLFYLWCLWVHRSSTGHNKGDHNN